MRTEYTIYGYLVGTIWMPATECYRELEYTFVRHEDERKNSWQDAKKDLREAMLHITNDGDFQSCAVADGVLCVRRVNEGQGRRSTRERTYDLARFPSVADMVRTDWEGPSC